MELNAPPGKRRRHVLILGGKVPRSASVCVCEGLAKSTDSSYGGTGFEDDHWTVMGEIGSDGDLGFAGGRRGGHGGGRDGVGAGLGIRLELGESEDSRLAVYGYGRIRLTRSSRRARENSSSRTWILHESMSTLASSFLGC